MTSETQERLRECLKSADRIVVKVGSGVLTGESYEDARDDIVAGIARQVARLVRQGRKILIVSSGSVAIGARMLNIPRRGLSIPAQQASAAVGQGSLITLWGRHFAEEGFKVGQVLITHDDLSNRRRFLNSRNTINTLLDLNIIPVINENDTVAVHEIKFGDNDTLSARVTNLVGADLLAILSDVDGLYTSDPRRNRNAEKIDMVEEVNDYILSIAKDSSTRTGTGGMASKVKAAAEAARLGATTLILPGTVDNSLISALSGQKVGTLFPPDSKKLSGKKHWIKYTLQPMGAMWIDKGAVEALKHAGKSLLASGVTEVEGDFESGSAVDIAGPDGKVFARGLVNYHSFEIDKIKGAHSGRIEEILGYKVYDEVIHRDDMVFFSPGAPAVRVLQRKNAE